MKYWIFDGSDVVGPLSPKELAARPDFVAVSLICPEYASEKAAGWRRASSFAEFHFEQSSGKLQLVSAPESEAEQETALAYKRMKKPARPSKAMLNNGVVRLSRNKNKVRLAKGEDLALSLPEQEVAVVKQKNTPKKTSTKSTPVVTSTQTSPTRQTTSLTHGMALVPEKNVGELPPLPEGDGTRFFAVGAGPADDLPEKELFLIPGEEIAAEVEAQSSKEAESVPAEAASAESENQPVSHNAEGPISTVSQIKPHLLPTPEIEEFLTDQQLAVVRPHRKGTKKILVVLLALLLLPGVGYLTWKTISRHSKVAVPAVESVGDEELALALTEPGNTTPAKGIPTVAPAPATASEKALAVVQNYQLSDERGTIASYFDRVYQDRLTQGYTAAWSVEPLHKSTYIVKYRLTKTRTEPIVYVFQADAIRNQLTGALNNAALDLVGKS